MDQFIGKMLDGRYEILEHIGTGGMAVVYKARCHRLNRLVAIKILKPELAADEDFVRRFHAESQAVAMLSHTNIVAIYDVSHSNGLNYIVMELIDGMTLKQYMKKRGSVLEWREALHFITQIVRALGHAHSRGIVHRDIKPHNIMVLRDGSVKVADFGIARLTSAVQSTLTQEALGSVHYISPEQAKGSNVDGRSDLYSAGVVLYEMLTGRLPFEGEAPVFVAIQHINSIPIPPRELNPDIPEALEAIIAKAMAPNPNQRYASAEDMLTDLREFRKNPGVVIDKPSDHQADAEVEEPTMVIPTVSLMDAKNQTAAASRRNAVSDTIVLHNKPVLPKEHGANAVAHQSRTTQSAKKAVAKKERDDVRQRKGSILPIVLAVVAIIAVIGCAVYFVYSFLLKDLLAPAPEYQIPDLRGYTIEEIDNALILGTFKIEIGPKVYNDEYAEGQICAQSPAPKSMVKDKKATISITISSGTDTFYMIDVENWDKRKALDTLQNKMGLIVNQETAFSTEVNKDCVISYTPVEGTMLHRGDSVTIQISRGPEEKLVTVPSFVNVSLDQAKSQLVSLGLKLGRLDYFYSDEYPEGRIIWQSLPATLEVDDGSVIDFQVSLGKEDVSSPAVSQTPGNDEIDVPSVDTHATTKTIQVDLRNYSGAVPVRVVVGNTILHDGVVESSIGTLTREVTGTGVQTVQIYVDGQLISYYNLDFNP